jgi:thiol-disulfide isomerase/thioredoxin
MRPLLLAAFAAAALAVPAPAPAAAAGEPAPAFTLPDASGAPIALDKLKGRVVYVDFWASWCGPCKRSFPWMGEMQKKYGDGGLTVVAINVDRKREDAAKFLAVTPGAFTIVYDPAGSVASSYDVKGMPTSYLVDRAGRIVAVDSGFPDDAKAAWEARIRSALDTK